LPYLDAYLRECLRLYSTAPNGVLKEVPAEGPPARIGPYEAQPGAVVWAPFWGLHLSSLNWERPMHFEPERWLGHDPRTAGAMSASRCPLSAAASAIRAATGAAPITATAETTATTATTATDTAAAAIAANAAASTAAAAPAPAPAAASTEAAASTGAAAAAAASAKSIRFMPFGDGARNCVGQHLALLQLKVVLSYMAARFELRLDEARMGGVAGAIARQRVNLTLEVEGGMWMTAQPRA
ncbi:Steroid 17-alpha-hydroxylase/17,20 lyase, partial [Tetrabaena socialis]